MKVESLGLVPRPEGRHRIRGHGSRWWHVGQRPAIRPSELEHTVGTPHDLVALLVHRTVMPPTQ